MPGDQPDTAAADEALRRLLNETEIRRVVDEIDNAVDAKDWARCRRGFRDETCARGNERVRDYVPER